MQHVEQIEGEYVNRGVVPGRKVLVEEGPAAVMVGPARALAHACAPQVELVRDGDIIRAIDVTCTCGEKIRLRCSYDDLASGA